MSFCSLRWVVGCRAVVTSGTIPVPVQVGPTVHVQDVVRRGV